MLEQAAITISASDDKKKIVLTVDGEKHDLDVATWARMDVDEWHTAGPEMKDSLAKQVIDLVRTKGKRTDIPVHVGWTGYPEAGAQARIAELSAAHNYYISKMEQKETVSRAFQELFGDERKTLTTFIKTNDVPVWSLLKDGRFICMAPSLSLNDKHGANHIFFQRGTNSDVLMGLYLTEHNTTTTWIPSDAHLIELIESFSPDRKD